MTELEAIEAAAKSLHASLTPTPQICWPLLSSRCGCEVWVKHENHTPVGAFKVRGGLLYIENLRQRHPDLEEIVLATRGNHGQSIAYACRRYALRPIVVVPQGNSQEKNRSMKALGAELVEHGPDFTTAFDFASQMAEQRGLPMVPSYDPLLVRGVATYSLELLRAVPDLDTVYVPIGLGSGICGMLAVRDALGSATRVVGVVAANAPAYSLSFAARRPVSTETSDTLADGVAVSRPDPTALEAILSGVDRIVEVSEGEIVDAMRHYFVDTHNIAEGAGAAPLAALLQESTNMQGRKVGLILSGGNVDADAYARVLQDIG